MFSQEGEEDRSSRGSTLNSNVARHDDDDDDDVSTRIRFLCLVFLPFPHRFTLPLLPFFSRTCVSRNRLATKDQPRREKESSRKRHGNLLLVRSFFPSHFSPLSFSFSLSLFFSFSIFSPTSPRIDEQSFLCASVDGSSPLTSLDICRLLSFGK